MISQNTQQMLISLLCSIMVFFNSNIPYFWILFHANKQFYIFKLWFGHLILRKITGCVQWSTKTMYWEVAFICAVPLWFCGELQCNLHATWMCSAATSQQACVQCPIWLLVSHTIFTVPQRYHPFKSRMCAPGLRVSVLLTNALALFPSFQLLLL